MSIAQLKFKTLIRKLSFLKTDLEYHRAEHERRRRVFNDEIAKHIETSDYVFSTEKASKNMVDVYDKKPAVSVPALEEQTKSIFKKVAKITHPDIDKKNNHKNKFIDARQALEEKDWFSMYEISADLGMEIPDISDEHILYLEQEILITEEIIKGITTTFEWVYCNEGSNKQQLLTTYCMLTCKLKE